MAYAFSQDVPINSETYVKIVERLGSEPAPGLILHLAYERPEGGLCYIDVWESEAHWERFAEERLHPVIHPILSELTGGNVPPEPERHPLPVIDVWRGEGSVRPLATSATTGTS